MNNTIQWVIVAVVVAAAVAYALFRLRKTLRGKSECSCGCSSCPRAEGCPKAK